ncbi:MAG: hypothetical protein ACR2NR_21290 [Solirubrobacteraceae bacterium]
MSGFVGLVAAAAAGPAGARRLPTRIVLYQSVAGVPLGLTPAEVKRRLGKPSLTTRVSGKIAELTYYTTALNVQFDTLHAGDPADFVGTTGHRYRTAKGIHVGSTVTAVKRAYRTITCSGGPCTLSQGHPGAIGSRSTAFETGHGKVESIDVQVVLYP